MTAMLAPLSATQLAQLRADANNVRGAAARKGTNANILKAFEHMGWSLERKQNALF